MRCHSVGSGTALESFLIAVRQGLLTAVRGNCARPFALFSELGRVGSVERGEKCTTKGRKIR
jgi:hypothetical protein